MANIFGTILSIGDFLKNETAQVTIVRGDESHAVFYLAKDRRYIIPDYQREIRWQKENLIELMSDISHRDRFLGNIILNKRSPLEYEVIDGQQRITVLLMIIYYIRNRYNQELDIFDTCNLEIANFDKFNILIENNFTFDNLNPDIKAQIEDSDVFNQRQQYHELWSQFEHLDMLRTADDCDAFLSNLKRSQFNLIVNTNDTDNDSINYFLDVNLKGVKLDTEDEFKGYLFSQDSSQTIRDEWKNFKILSFKLNEISEYSTTKLLEHYLYCSLFKVDKYRSVQFREDFSIYEVNIEGVKHYEGEHIIKAIRNNAYMIQSLKNINKFLTIILDILNNESPSQSFKGLFNPNANVDHIEKSIIHNFIKKIMRDTNVVPKILIMKYVIEVLFGYTDNTKEDYRKIYGAYLLAVIFTVFESDKSIKKVLGVVKDGDWYTKAVDQSKSYFSRSKISKTRITAQYKIEDFDNPENYMFRCKSLATIYNYFDINANTVRIINGKMNELKAYISDSEKFSDEHFVINKSGKYSITIGDTKVTHYPTEIKKYANSIFNFIFITRELNENLGNHILSEKIHILDEIIVDHPESIECEFSKMIIERCRINFSELALLPTETVNEAEHRLNTFYQDDFIPLFSEYALGVINKIAEKLGLS